MLARIKTIQKIDRTILPHAEKQTLIQIAILLFENNLTPTNQAIGDGIGENKDYIKNILTRLKSKGFINLIGRGKSRRVDIVWPKIFGNDQLPVTESFSNSQLPNTSIGNSQLPNRPPPPPTPILNKVVVVSLEKHGFDFGPVILEKLNRFSVEDQIAAIESTAANAKTNPSRYIEKILDNDCKGIKKIVPKLGTERLPSKLKLGDLINVDGFEATIIKREDDTGKPIFGAFINSENEWMAFDRLEQSVQLGWFGVIQN